ncbi:MAG: WD40/YVTN/BNR-like repeat-containing protein [Bacilli bacterium]
MRIRILVVIALAAAVVLGVTRTTRETDAAGPVIAKTVESRVTGAPTQQGYDAVDFLSARTGWVAGAGVWSTRDAGATWSYHKTGGWTLTGLDFINRQDGFAAATNVGIADYFALGSPQAKGKRIVRNAILRTTDGGATWRVAWQVRVPDTNASQYGAAAVHFVNPHTGFVLVNNELLSTGDGGRTWRRVPVMNGSWTLQSMSFPNARTGYVTVVDTATSAGSGASELLKTVDGGRHWRPLYRGTGQSTPSDVFFLNSSDGWFVLQNLSTMSMSLYRTTDGGMHFHQEPGAFSFASSVNAATPDFITPGFGWLPVAGQANGNTGGLGATVDGGKRVTGLLGGKTPYRTMNALDTSLVSRRVGYALVSQNGGMDSALVRTTDGGSTWTQVFPGAQPTAAISFASQQTGFGQGSVFSPGAQWQTLDGGRSWHSLGANSGYWSTVPGTLTFPTPAIGYVQTRGAGIGTLMRTADGGRRWTTVRSGPAPAPASAGPGVAYMRFFSANQGVRVITWFAQAPTLPNSSAKAPQGARRQVDSTAMVQWTQNGGRTWRTSSSTREPGLVYDTYSFVGAQTGFRLVDEAVAKEDALLRKKAAKRPPGDNWMLQETRDGGRRWTTVWSLNNTFLQLDSMDFVSQKVGYLELSAVSGQTLQAYILRTTDGGRTWVRESFGAATSALVLAPTTGGGQPALDFLTPTSGYMLTGSGILRTTDGGYAWTWLPAQ